MKQLTIFPEVFRSVWEKDDASFLEAAIPFYAKNQPVTRIVDCTCNDRRFWKDSEFKPLCIDINLAVGPDVVADCAQLPLASGCVDVLVYDPPHITDHDTEGGSKIWVEQYGARDYGDSISGVFPGFAQEAARVLRPGGLLFAKLTDHVHNHRFQWMTLDFVAAVRRMQMTPCDCIVKLRDYAIMSSKWEEQYHARRFHCTWLIVRNGRGCEARKS